MVVGVNRGNTNRHPLQKTQVKPYRGPPATLGSTAAAQARVIIWCCDCQHRVEPNPAEQAARHGADLAAAGPYFGRTALGFDDADVAAGAGCDPSGVAGLGTIGSGAAGGGDADTAAGWPVFTEMPNSRHCPATGSNASEKVSCGVVL